MDDNIELNDVHDEWDDDVYQDASDDRNDDKRTEETSFGGTADVRSLPDPPVDTGDDQRDRLQTEANIERFRSYYHLGPINRREIEFRSEGKRLFVKSPKNWVEVTQKSNANKFYALNTLKKDLGAHLFREIGLDRKSTPARKVASVVKKVLKMEENIPLLEMNTSVKGTEDDDNETFVKGTEDDDETFVQQIDRVSESLEDLTVELPRRELLALDKSLKTIRGTLTVQESKKVELERTLAQWREDLERNPDDRERIEREIDKTQNELDGVRESIDVLKGRLRSQFQSIKEAVANLLDGNTSLGERIATLFREQGVTLVSVLTAIGMTIAFLVELLIPDSPPPSLPTPPKPSDEGGGIKEWMKKQLDALGDLLSKLAGKLGNALPGILGSIASWLLSTLGKASVWLGEHLWVLATVVAGFLLSKLDEKKKGK